MTRRRGRPKGSSTDDYIMGIMCGLVGVLGPLDARYLARLLIKLRQVPRGGSDVSRIDRLARKIHSGKFRANTKECRDGIVWGMEIAAQHPDWGPPLPDGFDTPEYGMPISNMIKLARRSRAPKPK